MDLRNAAARFMTTVFTDAYDPTASVIRGSIKIFDEVTRSGPSSRRRILEVLPSTEIYVSSVVKTASGQVFVVGARNVDEWRGFEIRHKYPILPCDLTVKIGTTLQVLAGTLPAKTIYGYPSFVKGTTVSSESSNISANFYIYLSKAETPTKGLIVVEGGKYYRIRSTPYVDGAGFLVVDANLIDLGDGLSPVQTLNWVTPSTGYDPATDTVTNVAPLAISVFVEDAHLHYDFSSERYAGLKPGDWTITVQPAVVAKAGDRIGAYRVLSVDTELDGSKTCYCRRD